MASNRQAHNYPAKMYNVGLLYSSVQLAFGGLLERTMTFKRYRVLVAVTSAVLFNITVASSDPKVTGFFSDMHYIRESGDVVGTEVFILYSTDGLHGQYHALVQIAEGVPAPPVLVSVSVQGDSVQFSVPSINGLENTFKGHVTEQSLVGAWQGSAQQVTLPRGKSYWH